MAVGSIARVDSIAAHERSALVLRDEEGRDADPISSECMDRLRVADVETSLVPRGLAFDSHVLTTHLSMREQLGLLARYDQVQLHAALSTTFSRKALGSGIEAIAYTLEPFDKLVVRVRKIKHFVVMRMIGDKDLWKVLLVHISALSENKRIGSAQAAIVAESSRQKVTKRISLQQANEALLSVLNRCGTTKKVDPISHVHQSLSNPIIRSQSYEDEYDPSALYRSIRMHGSKRDVMTSYVAFAESSESVAERFAAMPQIAFDNAMSDLLSVRKTKGVYVDYSNPDNHSKQQDNDGWSFTQIDLKYADRLTGKEQKLFTKGSPEEFILAHLMQGVYEDANGRELILLPHLAVTKAVRSMLRQFEAILK